MEKSDSERATGAAGERARLAEVLVHETLAGNPPRIVAAIDLALKAPDMVADEIAAFVATIIGPTPEQRAAALRTNNLTVIDCADRFSNSERETQEIMP